MLKNTIAAALIIVSITATAQEEKTSATQVEQKQDENVALKKKPKKTQVAKNDSQNKTNDKATDDTPKDNA